MTIDTLSDVPVAGCVWPMDCISWTGEKCESGGLPCYAPRCRNPLYLSRCRPVDTNTSDDSNTEDRA